MKNSRILLLALIQTVAVVLHAQTNIGANDPNIQYVGRFDMTTPTAPGFDWSYSTIRAKFQGTSCSVKLDGPSKYFDVFIDGVKTGSITNASSGLQTFQVASGLSDTVHSLSLCRRVEASAGKNTFQGFVLDSGKTLVAPGAGPSRKIAFIGDSYTCGYGVEAAFGTPFTSATENACITYAAQMASHYNADCMITAWSGQGMVRNYNDPNQTSATPFPYFYPRTCGSVAVNDYAFAWQPDVVVIVLGINDFSTTPYPSQAQYVGGYSNFVKTVRSHYPNAHILCTYWSGMNSIASNYIATAANTAGDSKVHFANVLYSIDLPADYGSDYHPNASGQTKIANAFIPVFDSIMGTTWGNGTNASDDMRIYSGRFNNGWGDSWSWMPRYATNSPVYTNNPVYVASNSMALVPSGQWQAWWLKSGTTVDTTIYTNLTFWLYGSTNGQTISVTGELGGSGSGLPTVTVTAPSNSWQQFTILLSSLGVANKTNLTGFQFANTTTTQPRFIDDVRLVAAPAPVTVHVNVNANQTVRTVDSKLFSINQVAWDGSVNSAASVSILNNIGATCLRWPGGSWGDGYHWTNENMMAGDTSPRYWGSFSPDFIALATNVHSDAFIIVNYGTSTPEEAAYGVRMFNITNHCNFKYWEVGNEIGGSWEWDFRYPPFATNDILNLPSLANKLKTPTNNIATYLRTQFSSDTLSKLDAYVANPSANNASNLRWALVSDLNNLMYNGSQSIYKPDTNRFAGVAFRSVTLANLSLPIPPLGQDLNNRMVLEDAYPELAKITPEINLTSNWPDVDLPHDAWTYAKRFTNYYAQMKAVDPTIKVGALADVFEDGSANYSNHSAVNPRTGQTHYGWNPVMLSFLRDANCIPDFLIVHDYGPTAGDTQDLLYPRVWSSHAASLRQQLTDYLGAAGTNVTLEVTENGMGGDKQAVSLPGGLFYADSLGQILQTEFNSRIWWDMHNGGGAISNPDPAFYGWRKDGSGNYVSDGGIVNGDGVGTNGYPTYYVAKLLTRFAKGGDTVVSASSDYPLLATYAVQRTNGTLTLLVINKSSSWNLTANFNLSGFAPATNATVYSYGIPQDEAARTGIGSPDVAQSSITGVQGNFSATFAPFSASVMVLNPSGTLPPEMKALYTFEGNALDTSGSGNDGTPNVLSYVTGKTGSQAAQFNGTSSYVSIPRSIQDDFTVAMWVKTTDTAGTAGAQWWSGKGLVDGEVGGGGADWGTSIVNGKFVLGVGSSGGDTTLASSVNVNDGTWHHVAATRNNTSGAMEVYVDGILRGSGTGPTGSRTFPPNLRIGSLQTANNFLNGTLDDVRLYDRVLTIGEINGLAAPPVAPNGLAAIAGDSIVALSWSVSATATSYYVKRSTTSGSGYVNVATNATLTFTNTGLNNGTLYYYVVSALNGAGESTNSTQVSARPTSSASVAIGVTNLPGQLLFDWPADHTGWQLQTQTNNLTSGLGTNWVNVTGADQTNQQAWPLNATNGAVFFRLVRPY